MKAVVFDLGGVLVDWNPRYLFRQLFSDHNEMEVFLRDICNQDWNEQQDAGRTIEEATSLLVAQHPHYRPMIEAYYSRWPEMLGGAIRETVEVLNELRDQKMLLLALSNWSHETFPHARVRYSFLSHFKEIFVSGEYKMKKPDPKFYQILLEKHQLMPENTIFIDDVEKNISTAQKLGMHTVHFKLGHDLRSDLRKKGFLK